MTSTLTKHCRRCGQVTARYPRNGQCVPCARERRRKRPAEHRRLMAIQGTEVRLAKRRAQSKAAYARNPEKFRQRQRLLRAWGYDSSPVNLRRRTPPWLTAEERAEITLFYKNTPAGMTVDHKIPLSHKNRLVGGLHVMANLGYVSERANNRRRQEPPLTYDEAAAAVAAGLAVWAHHISAPDSNGKGGGIVEWSAYGP